MFESQAGTLQVFSATWYAKPGKAQLQKVLKF